MPDKPKVVVVTGAGAGLGRAIARRFAKDKARIGLFGRDNARLEAARREVEAAGGAALALPTDVADAGQVEAAAEAVERAFGPIDIWVNNAMVTVFSPFSEIKPEEYRRATEVTYLGTVYGTMAALKRMAPRDDGVIVQVGSALAYRSIPLQAPYCGAKAAIRAFTGSVRTELLHNGSRVHITMVQMPALNTPQFDWCRSRLPNHPQPVPPVYQPEVGAEAVVWAAANRRREVYVGWPTVVSIIGNKIAPGLLDRYLARTGYKSQQTGEPVAPDRPDNLFEPVRGDFAARGAFSARAQERSTQLWMTTHRTWLLLCASGFAIAAGAALRRKSR